MLVDITSNTFCKCRATFRKHCIFHNNAVFFTLTSAVNTVLFKSIIVQKDATLYSFIIFLQTVLHVLGVTLVKVSPETCRAVCRNIIKLYIVASCWTIIDFDSRCTGPMNIKLLYFFAGLIVYAPTWIL